MRLRSSGAHKRQYSLFDLFDGKRLSDIALRSRFDCLIDVLLAAFSCDHDDWSLGREVLAAQLAKKLESVHRGHIDVGENQFDLLLLQQLEAIVPGRRLPDNVQFQSRLAERPLDHLSHDRGVIHDQYTNLAHGFVIGVWAQGLRDQGNDPWRNIAAATLRQSLCWPLQQNRGVKTDECAFHCPTISAMPRRGCVR